MGERSYRENLRRTQGFPSGRCPGLRTGTNLGNTGKTRAHGWRAVSDECWQQPSRTGVFRTRPLDDCTGKWIGRAKAPLPSHRAGGQRQRTSTHHPRSALDLIVGFVAYGRLRNLAHYLRDVLRAPKAHWAKALFLDRLLADCFIKLWQKSRPDFSSLFLNAAAHLQHHYLFNSSAYSGPNRNPGWYIPPSADPVLEVCRLYDRLIGDVLTLDPRLRVLIVTGLHQDPVQKPVYYWRLRDHAAFLRKIQCRFASVESRMSRDFVVVCDDVPQAAAAQALLASGRDAGGVPLFEVDNRGTSIFVTLTYLHAIETEFRAQFGQRVIGDFSADVVFEAIKNAHHNQTGYLLDTGAKRVERDGQTVALTDVWQRIVSACT